MSDPGPPPGADVAVDAVVVGGGLIGMASAHALGAGGFRVALVDRIDPAVAATGAFDGRTTAVALGSRRVLERLGLWEAVAAHAEPMTDIRITDGDAPVFLHYDRAEVGDEPFGHIVENRLLRRAFWRALGHVPGMTVLAPAEVAACRRSVDGVEVETRDGRRIAARLAVAADGARSRLGREAGIAMLGRDYGQTALIATIGHEHPHGNVAYERFLASGPFAILPMGDEAPGRHRSSIVWTERTRLADAIRALPDDRFMEEVAWRFGDFLGALRLAGPRHAYPLRLHVARSMTAARLALVGDAAHAIHPVAGQGFNLGMRDVAVLAELAVDASRAGLDIGGPDMLGEYQRRRRFDGAALAAITDGLTRLFSNDSILLGAARRAGLGMVGRMPGLKRVFMRHAMGVSGRMSRLAGGEPL